MGDLERLDKAQGAIIALGEQEIPHPRELSFQQVLAVIGRASLYPMVETQTPRQDRAAYDAWAANHDLPDFQNAQRLCYLVDHFEAELTYDFRAFLGGTDMAELWRERRWRTMLMLIDRLPAHSWYSAALANDEQHAEMLAKAIAARGDDEDAPSKGPAWNTWTPEVAMLTQVVDAVRSLQHTLVAVNAEKAPPPPEPLPRPTGALEKAVKIAEFNLRKAKHQALVARVLPHKAQPAD